MKTKWLKNLYLIFFILIALILIGWVAPYLYLTYGMKQRCNNMLDIGRNAQGTEYFNDWFSSNIQTKNPFFDFIKGLGEVDSRVSPKRFERLNLDLTKLGFDQNEGYVKFNRDTASWEKLFDVDDIKSVSVGTGRSMVIYTVNNSTDIGDISWQDLSDKIIKIDKNVSVLCDE